jgi:hypothetical protein
MMQMIRQTRIESDLLVKSGSSTIDMALLDNNADEKREVNRKIAVFWTEVDNRLGFKRFPPIDHFCVFSKAELVAKRKSGNRIRR